MPTTRVFEFISSVISLTRALYSLPFAECSASNFPSQQQRKESSRENIYFYRIHSKLDIFVFPSIGNRILCHTTAPPTSMAKDKENPIEWIMARFSAFLFFSPKNIIQWKIDWVQVRAWFAQYFCTILELRISLAVVTGWNSKLNLRW